MRRIQQLLPADVCVKILEKNTSGVLALAGDDGYPYALPLSYCYADSKIVFHCALEGHKIDAIKQNPKVSFCVIDKDEVIPDEYTTYYRSVIIFGKARILVDKEEKLAAMKAFAAKYTPDNEKGRLNAIESSFDRMNVVEISIEHMSGKEAKELSKRRTALSKGALD
ncbi:MAG: pyridoxamine 5'-phosphate oxidase family protein [Spirochaetaceae bacterium]|nr:pyridoxamine 5'-phosphate oxidase family protein [Spirochaetaceae bacterium]